MMPGGGSGAAQGAVARQGSSQPRPRRGRNPSQRQQAANAAAAEAAEARKTSRHAGRKRKKKDDAPDVDSDAEKEAAEPSKASESESITSGSHPPKPTKSKSKPRERQPNINYRSDKQLKDTFKFQDGCGTELPPMNWRTTATKVRQWFRLKKEDQETKIAEWEAMTDEEQKAITAKVPKKKYPRKKKKDSAESSSATAAAAASGSSTSTTAARGRRSRSKTTDTASTDIASTPEHHQPQLHDKPPQREGVAKEARSSKKPGGRRPVGSSPKGVEQVHDAAVIENENQLLARAATHHRMITVPKPKAKSKKNKKKSKKSALLSNINDKEDLASLNATNKEELIADVTVIIRYRAKESPPSGGPCTLRDDNTRKVLVYSSNRASLYGAVNDASQVFKPSSACPHDTELILQDEEDEVVDALGKSSGLAARTKGSLNVYKDVGSYTKARKDRREAPRARTKKGAKTVDEVQQKGINVNIGVVGKSPGKPSEFGPAI